MMKKYVAFLVILLILCGCAKRDPIGYTLGVDVSYGTVMNHRDDHGGFHGDGLLAVTVSFSKEQSGDLISKFQQTSGWHSFPMSENVCSALYGNGSRGALILGEDMDPLPEIKEGWYFFRDRHPRAEDPFEDSALFSRGSFNVTLAVFDSETGMLYFYELDT